MNTIHSTRKLIALGELLHAMQVAKRAGLLYELGMRSSPCTVEMFCVALAALAAAQGPVEVGRVAHQRDEAIAAAGELNA